MEKFRFILIILGYLHFGLYFAYMCTLILPFTSTQFTIFCPPIHYFCLESPWFWCCQVWQPWYFLPVLGAIFAWWFVSSPYLVYIYPLDYSTVVLNWKVWPDVGEQGVIRDKAMFFCLLLATFCSYFYFYLEELGCLQRI